MRNSILALLLALLVPAIACAEGDLSGLNASYASSSSSGLSGKMVMPTEFKLPLPWYIGGAQVGPLDLPDYKADTDKPESRDVVCYCPDSTVPIGVRVGMRVDMKDMEEVIDESKRAGYSAFLGKSVGLKGPEGDAEDGINKSGVASTTSHTHVWHFPLLSLVGIVSNINCSQPGDGISVSYVTEVMPQDNDPFLTALVYVETALFANPVAPLSCILCDGMQVGNGKRWCDWNFWCAWGPIYPLGTSNSNPKSPEGAAQLAAKGIYKLYRFGSELTWTEDYCKAKPSWYWRKSDFKAVQIRPVRNGKLFDMGDSIILSRAVSNPPFGTSKGPGEQYLFEIVKKKKCCLSKK